VVDAGDSAVPAVVGRTRTRTSGVVPGHQRDDQAQSDSDDSEMDRFYSLQLGRNTSRCARSFPASIGVARIFSREGGALFFPEKVDDLF